MITDSNYCFGVEKPSELMLTNEGVRINSNIHSKDAGITGHPVMWWYAISSLIPVGDDAYFLYKRMIELQQLSDEHDELIAEIIEGGNA